MATPEFEMPRPLSGGKMQGNELSYETDTAAFRLANWLDVPFYKNQRLNEFCFEWPFKYLNIWKRLDTNKYVVAVCTEDGQQVKLEDDVLGFPSQTLIAKLILLKNA